MCLCGTYFQGLLGELPFLFEYVCFLPEVHVFDIKSHCSCAGRPDLRLSKRQLVANQQEVQACLENHLMLHFQLLEKTQCDNVDVDSTPLLVLSQKLNCPHSLHEKLAW